MGKNLPIAGPSSIPELGGDLEDRHEAPPVCRKLRTKLSFSAMVTPDGAPLLWQRGDGGTAVYWCLRTMECAGPDGGLAHAGECGPGRACYLAQGHDEPC